MYKDMNFESILQRMLSRVPDSMDKREGSIIYDALAPAAVEFQNMLLERDFILDETYPDTASREYLIKRAKERGIEPNQATHAILKAEFNIEVPIGSRFNCEELNYIVTEKIDGFSYKVQCETAGTAGNKNNTQIIPIDYIDGLEMAEITEILIPGDNEEETEAFRKRYFDSFDSQAFGGNIADYKEKVLAINGVGGVKVYPVWNGGGTVKLVIMDSTFGKPSDTLVDTVQSAIDPIGNQGKGVGLAPIGHTVTVLGCEETVVNIVTDLTFQEGWDFTASKPYIEQAIDDYFREIAQEWDSSESLLVRVSQLETRILSAKGVLDIADTTINGEAKTLTLAADSIPVRGSVTNG